MQTIFCLNPSMKPISVDTGSDMSSPRQRAAGDRRQRGTGAVIGWATFMLFFPRHVAAGSAAWAGLLATILSFCFGWYVIVAHRRMPATDAVWRRDPARAVFIECTFITILTELPPLPAPRRGSARWRDARDGPSPTPQRYRAFVQNSSEAIWRFECERPIPTASPG